MEETYRTSVCLRALADSAEVPDAKSIAERLRGLRDENLADIQVIVSGAVEDAANNKQEMTQKFLIVTTTSIFNSALELEKSKVADFCTSLLETRSAAKASARV